MATVMITGGNRGIGLEMVKRYLAREDTVIATYREESRAQEILALETRGYDPIIPVQLEVRDQASIEACFAEVSSRTDTLDLLVNNAGMGDYSVDLGDPAAHKDFGHLRAEALLDVLHVNAVAPVMVTQAFVRLMEWADEPKVAHMSSQMGSIGLRGDSGYYSYSASKTALNMLGRIISHDLASMGIVSVMLHPGWVKTSMGGPEAPLSIEESVDGLIKVIDGLTAEDNGKFLDYKGTELPW